MTLLYRAIYRSNAEEIGSECYILAETMEVAVQKVTEYINVSDTPDARICLAELVASEDGFGSLLLVDHSTEAPEPVTP